MTANKTFAVGAAVAVAGVGAFALTYYYCPSQAAAAIVAGDEERSGMLTECAFSLRDCGRLFTVLILAGLALMVYASESVSA